MLFIHSELATASARDAVRAASQSTAQQQVAMAGAAVTAICRLPVTGGRRDDDVRRHRLHVGARSAPVLEARHQPGRCGRAGKPNGHVRWVTPADPHATSPSNCPTSSPNSGRGSPRRSTTPRRCTITPRVGRIRSMRSSGRVRSAVHLPKQVLFAPHFAAPWGLDASPAQQLIIDEEFDKRPFLVRPSLGIAQWILPTVLAAGSGDQRRQFADPTLRGEIGWCQPVFRTRGRVGSGLTEHQGHLCRGWVADQRSEGVDLFGAAC